MKPSNHSSQAQIDDYYTYAERTRICSKRDVSDIINNVKGGSLKEGDKQGLFHDLMMIIAKEIK